MVTGYTPSNLIKKIKQGEELEDITDFVRKQLFQFGPKSVSVLEAICYLKVFQPTFFETIENEIIQLMGVFFKPSAPSSFPSLIFSIFQSAIKNDLGNAFTPTQVDILSKLKSNRFFSFSAPTSTGKSYIFRQLIKDSSADAVVIVPSRALINEYLDLVTKMIDQRTVNVLPFVEHINIDYAERNIFILTPERARELFKNKDWLNVDFFLFDEAQLADDRSHRGLYFDGLVRRIKHGFPNSKIVFAHPFITNPQAQFIRNGFTGETFSKSYSEKNVGQIFYAYDRKQSQFYHFGIDKEIMGAQKIPASGDPIARILTDGGSVLIYTSKLSITSKRIYEDYKDYIALCSPIKDQKATTLIESLREYIGASSDNHDYYFSEMVDKMSQGIVIHHGSIPLAARKKIEEFVNLGFCKICFATSTLEQGINMPFDLVFLNRFEKSRPLSIKNLIGRAGRSTKLAKFDYGRVVIPLGNMSDLRRILTEVNTLSTRSRLDIIEHIDEKYEEFKESINSGTYSDEYNLTPIDIANLSPDKTCHSIEMTLHAFNSTDTMDKASIVDSLKSVYTHYLGRNLTDAEFNVFKTAVQILIWRWEGKSFHEICRRRFAYISRISDRQRLVKNGESEKADKLPANFACGYKNIPDKLLENYPLFSKGTLAHTVDYDRIVFDTYDYLDQLIGFKLSDVFYAAFHQYYTKTHDEQAGRFANLIKYGTSDRVQIMLLKYGIEIEDTEWIKPLIRHIDENRIIFTDEIESVPLEKKAIVEHLIH